LYTDDGAEDKRNLATNYQYVDGSSTGFYPSSPDSGPSVYSNPGTLTSSVPLQGKFRPQTNKTLPSGYRGTDGKQILEGN